MHTGSPIPGLFPPCVSAKNPGVQINARGGLRYCFFSAPAEEPHSFSLLIRSIGGKELLRDEFGAKIFRHTRGNLADYYIITDPYRDHLPRNTSLVHVLVDCAQDITFPIVLESDAFQIPPPTPLYAPGINQVGDIYLEEGHTTFQFDFPVWFRDKPRMVLTQVLGDVSANPALSIVANPTGWNNQRCSGTLSLAPNTRKYRLGWVAWC